MKQANEAQLRKIVSDSLVIWKEEEEGWVAISKENLFSDYQKELNAFFELIHSKNYIHFSASEDFYLNNFTLFEPYFDDCGEFDSVRYPYYEVVVTSKETNEQSHFSFLSTNAGWQLVSLTLR